MMRARFFGRRFVIALTLMAVFNAGFFTSALLARLRTHDPLAELQGLAHISPPGVMSAPQVWVAIDPYCRYCHQMYRELTARVAAGEIRVHWIPVSLVHPDSAAVGAELLSAVDPAAALEKWFGSDLGTSPVIPNGEIANRNLVRISLNTQSVSALTHTSAVPALFYRSTDGKPVVVIGIPADLNTVLGEIKAGATT